MVTSTSPEEISLYFHVPFCKKKCDYCHFYVIPDKDLHKQQYMAALKVEWDLRERQIHTNKLKSIYFGGGTPSLLGPKKIGEILNWVRKSFSDPVEVTLEANPEGITAEQMREYAAVGVNRVSIGVQSFNDTLLTKLSRNHSGERARKAIEEVSQAGIDNISIDLMYDIPYQTLEQWKASLAQATALPITHLSLYNLTIEPKTVFFKKKKEIHPHLPDEQTSLVMLQTAIDTMVKNEFSHYEISAFAKNGQQSIHNTGYWQGRAFIGFGPSAFSYWNNKRFRNTANINRYHKNLELGMYPVDYEEELDEAARRREILTIQLRMLEGFNILEFQKRWGDLEQETSEKLTELTCLGLLKKEGEIISLTAKGITLHDAIAEQLI